MAKNNVVDQVKDQVSDARTRVAMLFGSAMEGGWGPRFSPGDNDTSFGPFQMHWGGALGPMPTTAAARAQSQHDAEDPKWAVAHMKGSYGQAARAVPDALWSSNPELAAEQSAFIAERPAEDYVVSRGQAAVDQAYAKAKGALSDSSGTSWFNYLNPIYDAQQVGGAIGGAIGGAAGAVGGAVGGAVSDAASALWGDVKDFVITMAFAGLGLSLVVIGGYETAKPTISRAREGAQQAAGTAAMAAAL